MANHSNIRFVVFVLVMFIKGFCYSQDSSVEQLTNLATNISLALREIRLDMPSFENILREMTDMMAPLYGVVQCDRGWHKLENTCYFFSESKASWEVSNQKCIGMKAYFAKAYGDDEFAFLQKLAIGDEFWIGLRRTSNYGLRWIKDNSLHFHTLHWWNEGEPHQSEDDVCIYFRKNGRLTNINCNKEFRYVCEKPATATMKKLG